MKTLYLHIGCAKTGTSAIQSMLKNNADLLLKNGYAFPLHPHRYSSAAIRRNGHFLVLKKKMMDADGKEPKAAWKERLNTGLEMVHRAFESCDNVILSDEGLWFGINYDPGSFLDILPADARENGYCLKVVVYLRRQDLFLTSLWNQKVKYKKCTQTLSDFLTQKADNNPLYIDYDATLRKIAGVIGAENIIVRRYEETSWPRGSIYADFLNAIGLPEGLPVSIPDKKINISLSANAIEIQRIINSSTFLTQDDRRRLSACVKTFSKNESGSHTFRHLSAEETAAFLAPFREGNERIARDFLRDGRPLFSEEIEGQSGENRSLSSTDILQFFLVVAQDIWHQTNSIDHQTKLLLKPRRRFGQLKKAIRHPRWALEALRYKSLKPESD